MVNGITFLRNFISRTTKSFDFNPTNRISFGFKLHPTICKWNADFRSNCADVATMVMSDSATPRLIASGLKPNRWTRWPDFAVIVPYSTFLLQNVLTDSWNLTLKMKNVDFISQKKENLHFSFLQIGHIEIIFV